MRRFARSRINARAAMSCLLAAAALLGAPRVASGQGAATRGLVITVAVTDSLHAPIAGATVRAHGAGDASTAAGMTGADGRIALRLPRQSDSVEVIARKLGFTPERRTVAGRSDSLVVAIELRGRAVQELGAVTVTDTRNAHRLTLDGDDIAESTRPMTNALDALLKLRPDIVQWFGENACNTMSRYVMVNGRKVSNVPADFLTEQKVSESAGAASQRTTGVPGAGLGSSALLARLPADVRNVLATIRPEDVAAIETSDCHESSVAELHIRLKPGVRYEDGRMSAMLDQRQQDSVMRSVLRPGVRVRPRGTGPTVAPLLGVYDPMSGEALAAADVLDVATGAHASTSETGTVSLGFVTARPALVVITKPGYDADTLRLEGGIADTMPITVLLHASGTPRALATSAAPLHLIGVFDVSSGAPVADAEVIDLATGSRTRTSETGTASVDFVLVRPAVVLISKPGYQADTLRIPMGPADTVPVTHLLRPAAPRR